MPVVNIDAAWLSELLGQDHPIEELSGALEQIGCDVEEVTDIARYRCPSCRTALEGSMGSDTLTSCTQCGHQSEQPFESLTPITVIRLDLLAARPDLFDIGGLSRALEGYLGRAEGLPSFEVGPASIEVQIDPALSDEQSYRPFMGCAVAELPPLDDRLLAAVMKLQENLHWGVGRDRKLASIGVYDLAAIKPPIRYCTLDPDGEPFEPLGMAGRVMTGRQILEQHPKGAAYAHLLTGLQRFPVLVDAAGQVLSMPPIINSEATRVKAGSKRLFIDVTGISEAAVEGALNTLVCSLMALGAEIEAVRLSGPDGERSSPVLTPRTTEITRSRANRWLGLGLGPDELMACLKRMRLDVSALDQDGERFAVRYPAFRSDIRHMVDVFEDVAVGYGYQRFEPALVPTMTVSAARPEELLSEQARTVMIGLGYSEVMSLPVTTEEDHFTRLGMAVPEHYVRVGNPKLKALTVVRSHLMGGIMQALREGRRRPMPLRMFELDNAVELDDAAAYGVTERRRLCFAEVGREAGYASARTALDALLGELGHEGVYQAAEHAAFVPGRCARVQAGTIGGLIGELRPQVVVGFGLEYPVALVDVALTTS